jgi:hypothetical protein
MERVEGRRGLIAKRVALLLAVLVIAGFAVVSVRQDSIDWWWVPDHTDACGHQYNENGNELSKNELGDEVGTVHTLARLPLGQPLVGRRTAAGGCPSTLYLRDVFGVFHPYTQGTSD